MSNEFKVSADGKVVFPDGAEEQIAYLMKREDDGLTLFLLPDYRQVELSAEETTVFLQACYDAKRPLYNPFEPEWN
jgi:hypothetical protein